MSVTQFYPTHRLEDQKEEEEEEATKEEEPGEEQPREEPPDDKKDEDEDESEDDELTPLNPETRQAVRQRIGRVDWCQCHNCVPMTTEEESRCCHEDPKVWQKVVDDWCDQGRGGGSFRCVVEHPFFTSVCLNPYAIQALYSRDKRLFGVMVNKAPHEKYRITSYRAFVDYFHGKLQGYVTLVLPSCVVSTIRGIYPDHAFLLHVPGYGPL